MTKFTSISTGYEEGSYGYHMQVIVVPEAEDIISNEARVNNLDEEQIIGGIVHSHYEDSLAQLSELMGDPESYKKTHIFLSSETENKFAVIFLLAMDDITCVVCTVEQAEHAEQCLTEGIFDFGFINLRMSDDG